MKEKIEEEIRIYENSDFRNLQSKFQNKHIRDPKVKNGEKNTDYDSSEMNMYQPNMLSSAEWNKLKSTNEESSHQSVQTKKDNKENYVLKLCKRCGGNGCLLCHNTGYENH